MKSKICVIGLGEVGLPTAVHMAREGFSVYGYDINKTAVKYARAEGIKATDNWKAIRGSIEAYIVCVPTGIDAASKPDMSIIFDVAMKICSNMDKGNLVSIESTVLPGTCRTLYNDFFKRTVNLIHVPHRFWKDDPINHGVKQNRVIGGIDSQSLKMGVDLYQHGLGIPLHSVPSIEIAEMSKIVENSHRFLQIAFAEEIRMICGELDIDAGELRNACNTKWNVEMLEARDGIGRHCLPKDIRYLISLSKKSKLLKSAVCVNDNYLDYLRKEKKNRIP